MDIALNFFTGFLGKNGAVVTSQKQIVTRYLRTWFLPDVLSTLPLEARASPRPGSAPPCCPRLPYGGALPARLREPTTRGRTSGERMPVLSESPMRINDLLAVPPAPRPRWLSTTRPIPRGAGPRAPISFQQNCRPVPPSGGACARCFSRAWRPQTRSSCSAL